MAKNGNIERDLMEIMGKLNENLETSKHRREIQVQQSTCTELINQAIATLQSALDNNICCDCKSSPCACAGHVISSIVGATVSMWTDWTSRYHY